MASNLQVTFPAAARGPSVVRYAAAAPPNLKPYVEKLVSGESLTKQEANEVCAAVLEGAEPMQVASCLMLMRRNGESAAEVAGFVQAMSDACVPVKVPSQYVTESSKNKLTTLEWLCGMHFFFLI